MTEYQITYWRELPSLVVAREGDDVTKVALPQRFQEAIDEAAMRLGDTGSDEYLAGWRRTAWTPADEDRVTTVEKVAAGLERDWPEQAVAEYLDTLGQKTEETA